MTSAAKQLPGKKYDKTRHKTNWKVQDTEMDKDILGKKSCAEYTKTHVVSMDCLQDNKNI